MKDAEDAIGGGSSTHIDGDRRTPQVVAHRGYKRLYPENTLLAFQQALGPAGHHCDGIETDVHVSADGVVVLSHDADVSRCFGEAGYVTEMNYAAGGRGKPTDERTLSALRTAAAPHVPMPTLQEALTMLQEPAFKHAWLLLDIKLTNDVSVVSFIAQVLKDNGGVDVWRDRLILGIWHHKFMPHCQQHLSGLKITHIGLHTSYAAQRFLDDPAVISFNMQLYALACPAGERFVQQAHQRGKQVYVWTANDESWIRYCAQHLQVDVILTDDPALCCTLLDNVQAGGREAAELDMNRFWTRKRRWTARFWRGVLYLLMLTRIYWTYREREPSSARARRKKLI